MIVATVSFFFIWFAITWFILLRLQLCSYRKSDSERLSEFLFSMTPISFCLGTAACSPSFFMGYGFLFSLHILGANSVLFLAILSSVFFYSCFSLEGEKLKSRCRMGCYTWAGSALWILVLFGMLHPAAKSTDAPYIRFSSLFATSSIQTRIKPATIRVAGDGSGGLDLKVAGGRDSRNISISGDLPRTVADKASSTQEIEVRLDVDPSWREQTFSLLRIVSEDPEIVLRFMPDWIWDPIITTKDGRPLPFVSKNDEIFINTIPDDGEIHLSWKAAHGYTVQAVVTKYDDLRNFVNGPLPLGIIFMVLALSMFFSVVRRIEKTTGSGNPWTESKR